MAITILELAKHRGLKEEPDGSFSMGAINAVGLEIMGGCQRCGASLGCYNGCPSKSGYWMCKDGCIGDDGYATVEEANAAIFGESKPQTVKVWALATDGNCGTNCSIFTSEMDLWASLAEDMCDEEEMAKAKGFIEANDLDALQDFLTNEDFYPPELFTYCIDEREIEVPPDPLLLTADGYRRGQIETLEAKCDCGANLYGIIRVHHCNEGAKQPDAA